MGIVAFCTIKAFSFLTVMFHFKGLLFSIMAVEAVIRDFFLQSKEIVRGMGRMTVEAGLICRMLCRSDLDRNFQDMKIRLLTI